MSNATTTLAQLTESIAQFTRERDWEPFHHPKDLGLALAIEVGELLEHFRYRTNEQIKDYLADHSNKTELAHEVADCAWLLFRLADVCQFDLADAMKQKLILAAQKYPADLVRGKPDKYTAYTNSANPRRESDS